MDWYPHKTVATVVEREGRFLMVKESIEGHIVYNQPAGHLEAGESLQQAALRETLEETGWQVELTHFLGLYQYTSPDNGICYVRSCFIAAPVEALEKQPPDPAILEAVWLSADEIRSLSSVLRSPIVGLAVEDYLKGVAYPLSLISHVELPRQAPASRRNRT